MTQQALPAIMYDDKNGLTYVLHGDYYFPLVVMPQDDRPIGKYGRMRKKYLEEHRPVLYNILFLNGTLYRHLAEIDQTCNERMELMVRQMAEREGVTEALKATAQLEWVGRMNSIQNRAEEIILSEVVYE